jgi:hypothetical protein
MTLSAAMKHALWWVWPSAFYLVCLSLSLGLARWLDGDGNLLMMLLCFFAANVAVYGTLVSGPCAWLLRNRSRWVRRLVTISLTLLAGPAGIHALDGSTLSKPADALCQFSEDAIKSTGAEIRSLVRF